MKIRPQPDIHEKKRIVFHDAPLEVPVYLIRAGPSQNRSLGWLLSSSATEKVDTVKTKTSALRDAVGSNTWRLPGREIRFSLASKQHHYSQLEPEKLTVSFYFKSSSRPARNLSPVLTLSLMSTHQFHLLKHDRFLGNVVTALFLLQKRNQQKVVSGSGAGVSPDTLRARGRTLSIWMSMTLSMYFFLSYLSLMKISADWSLSGRWKHLGKKASYRRLALAFPISWTLW